MKVLEVVEVRNATDYTWTTGNNSAISHVRLIDSGAAGEVHEDIQNEVHAVLKLCRPGSPKSIVAVLGHGNIPPSYYFIDMELCDINLESYIQCAETRKRLPPLSDSSLQWTKMVQLWDLMEDIASGIAFIHSEKEIHRDLKPRNSKSRILAKTLIEVKFYTRIAIKLGRLLTLD